MNHLLSINELRTSTYLSAADKLKPKHPKRASRLVKHASKFGTHKLLDDPSNYFTDSYPFKISHEFQVTNSDIDGEFFIISYGFSNDCLKIFMASEDNKKISIDLQFGSDRNEPLTKDSDFGEFIDLWISEYDDGGELEYDGFGNNSEDYFTFNNRKDANYFKKFIVEYFPDKGLEKIKINDLYQS